MFIRNMRYLPVMQQESSEYTQLELTRNFQARDIVKEIVFKVIALNEIAWLARGLEKRRDGNQGPPDVFRLGMREQENFLGRQKVI